MKPQKIDHQGKFLRRVFKQRPDAKQIFDGLVGLGCDHNMLRGGMFQISFYLTLLRSQGVGDRRYLSAWDFMGLPSRRELARIGSPGLLPHSP
jgi:hypothetical protein